MSEALRLKAEAEKAEAERAAENGEEPPVPHRAVSQRGMPPGTTMHMLKVIRTHEGLEEGSNHYKSLTLVCRAVVGLPHPVPLLPSRKILPAYAGAHLSLSSGVAKNLIFRIFHIILLQNLKTNTKVTQ